MERLRTFTDCSVFMLAIKLEVGYTIPRPLKGYEIPTWNYIAAKEQPFLWVSGPLKRSGIYFFDCVSSQDM